MVNFTITAVADSLSPLYNEMVINAFMSFYSNVTFKHQRRLKLNMLSSDDQLLYALKSGFPFHQIECRLIHTIVPSDLEISGSSIIVLPENGILEDIVVKSYALGIPVISRDMPKMKNLVDHSTGIILKEKKIENLQRELSEVYKMLYFDPEACKFMKKGAHKKYQILTNWNLNSSSSMG